MCLLYLLILYAGVSALAIWLLPHWLSIPLVTVVGVVLLFVIWKVRGFVKKVKAKFGDLIPQEKVCSLAANEPFNSHGFAFTFPVACEVNQTHFRDVVALVLKPKLEFDGAPKDTLLIASTFPPADLKEKISNQIEKVFSQVEGHASEPEPITLGQMQGERRAFATSKDGKDVRGESVFLGDEKGSIGWVAIGEGAAFETLAAKYRELAMLIQRTETPRPPTANPS